MGKLATVSRKYQLKELQDIHHEIKRLRILGMKSVDIAHYLGITEAVVSYTLNSELMRRELEMMRGARDSEAIDVAKQIKEMAPKALKVLEGILEDELVPAPTRLATAKDVLDRGGYGASRQIDIRGAVGYFTAQDIEEIKDRARAQGLIAGGNGKSRSDGSQNAHDAKRSLEDDDIVDVTPVENVDADNGVAQNSGDGEGV
jgi:hypothetical protein